MILVEVFFIVIGTAYFLMISLFIIGWDRIRPLDNKESEFLSISIVIPVRNEEQNIEKLLLSLKNQNYPEDHIEIIFVDDHSSDATSEKIINYGKHAKNIKYYFLGEGQGKKAALSFGIHKALNNYIVTTDGDCKFSSNWIKSIAFCFIQENPDVIIGPVLMTGTKGVFQKFQELEFMSLIASTAGAVGLNNPIMANGANLAFKKDVFFRLKENLGKSSVSGDDIFLIHEAKKKKFKIHYLKARDSYVATNPAVTLKSFLDQRTRWVSKSKYYNDYATILVSFIVLVSNGSILAACFLALIKFNFIYLASFIFGIKLIIDFVLLIKYLRFYNKTNLLRYYFPLQIIYPFYIVIVTIIGLLGNFNWKGRHY